MKSSPMIRAILVVVVTGTAHRALIAQPPPLAQPTNPPSLPPHALILQTSFANERDPSAPVRQVPQAVEEQPPPPEPVPSIIEPNQIDTSNFSWAPSTGNHRFGMMDLELGDRLTNPWLESLWSASHQVFHARMGFGVHWWNDPRGDAATPAPDPPPKVFDLYLDCVWHVALTDWFTAHVDVTPGIYTDFRTTPPEAFRWRMKGVGIVNLTDQVQVAAGVDYVNRLTVRTLPAGGVIWEPSCDTRCELVFPYPRITHRFYTRNGHEWWGYVAGEWGGGAWAFKNNLGGHEWTEYDDYRVLFGIEWLSGQQVSAHIEAGYVFHREMRYLGAMPDFNPSDGMLLRIGLIH